MTQEQQQIAIAEFCKIPEQTCIFSLGYDKSGIIATSIPDYLNDLNAMHELEKVLTIDQRRVYSHKLLLIFERNDETRSGTSSWHYLHATASQRAEAFLRALNLWTN